MVEANGKILKGHKLAVAIYKLSSGNTTTAAIARKNMEYIRNAYDELKDDMLASNVLNELVMGIAEYSSSDEAVSLTVESHKEFVGSTLLLMSSLFMDLYLMTIAFLARSTEKIVFAGHAHTNKYVDMLVTTHGYSHDLSVVNVVEFADDNGQGALEYARCLNIPDLPDYIDINVMKDGLYKS